jgi:hypothetical protein
MTVAVNQIYIVRINLNSIDDGQALRRNYGAGNRPPYRLLDAGHFDGTIDVLMLMVYFNKAISIF